MLFKISKVEFFIWQCTKTNLFWSSVDPSESQHCDLEVYLLLGSGLLHGGPSHCSQLFGFLLEEKLQ